MSKFFPKKYTNTPPRKQEVIKPWGKDEEVEILEHKIIELEQEIKRLKSANGAWAGGLYHIPVNMGLETGITFQAEFPGEEGNGEE